MSDTNDLPVKRECGPCSMCCKLLGVATIKKPQGKWCPSCLPGKGGCSVHTPELEPPECVDFECLWLQSTNDEIPDHWRPDKIRIVLAASRPVEGEVQTVVAWVDPVYPNKLRMPEVLETFRRLVTEQGIDVTARIGMRTLKLGYHDDGKEPRAEPIIN